MIKKIITIVLITAFLNMVAVSAFADTDAEKDRNQQRAVLAAIGIVCLVGSLYMLSKMGKEDFAESYYSSILRNKSADNGFKIDIGFYNSDFYKQGFSGNRHADAPALKLIYSW